MFAISLVSIWLALTPQGRGGVPSPASAPPVLEISARVMQADGQPMASASKSGTGSFDGYVWSDTQCDPGSGARDTSKAPAIGWKFSARVVQQMGDMLSVQIDWQRVWDNQKRLTDGPKGTTERTIRMGDRIEIDHFDLGSSARSCGASAVQFEATAMRGATSGAMNPGAVAMAGGRGARGGAAAGAGARGGTGTGFGAGGGRGFSGQGGAGGRGQGQSAQGQQSGQAQQGTQGQQGGQGQQAAQGQQGAQGQGGQGQQGAQGQQTQQQLNARQLAMQNMMAQQGQGFGRGAAAGMGRGGRGGSATSFNAELWLVHTVPAGAAGLSLQDYQTGNGARGGRGGRASFNQNADNATTVEREVAHQSVRFAASGSGFAFPAMSIETNRGTVGVIVTGTLNAKVDNGAPTTLVVTVNRQAISPDGSASTSGGSSTKEIPWPANGDVISFELPSATGAGQDPAAQERLSIRLRIGTGVGAIGGGRGTGAGAGRGGRR